MADDDCWNAFGSDDDDDDDDDCDNDDDHHHQHPHNDSNDEETSKTNYMAHKVALFVSQFLLQQNPHIHLNQRIVSLRTDHEGIQLALHTALEQVGIILQTTTKTTTTKAVQNGSCRLLLDVLIVLQDEGNHNWDRSLLDKVLPGGLWISSSNDMELINDQEFQPPCTIHGLHESTIVARTKLPARVHANTCPWLPTSHSLSAEQERLQQATIVVSAYESSNHKLTEWNIQRAVRALTNCGYCVIPNLLDSTESSRWGQAVLDSVHEAANILLERDHVDIYHPHTSEFEPQAYRELSMREDLRLDLRHGPALNRLRSTEDRGNEVVILRPKSHFTGFLRGHASLLEILYRTMNPKSDTLYKGNMGRYNFNGSGPDGSYQDLRLSIVGGIVSFPGAGDQALHADTPHLFEHIPDLPAHYINVFTPGVAFDKGAGGTAFVHGSHNLQFTAKFCDDHPSMFPHLVRPCLSLGDVVLFDCRILHFGMANHSSSVERVLLYTNSTHAWFHDPKNWDHQSIFENLK